MGFTPCRRTGILGKGPRYGPNVRGSRGSKGQKGDSKQKARSFVFNEEIGAEGEKAFTAVQGPKRRTTSDIGKLAKRLYSSLGRRRGFPCV